MHAIHRNVLLRGVLLQQRLAMRHVHVVLLELVHELLRDVLQLQRQLLQRRVHAARLHVLRRLPVRQRLGVLRKRLLRLQQPEMLQRTVVPQQLHVLRWQLLLLGAAFVGCDAGGAQQGPRQRKAGVIV